MTGLLGEVFMTSTGSGDDEAKSTNNNVTVNCSTATSELDSCSLVALKGDGQIKSKR